MAKYAFGKLEDMGDLKSSYAGHGYLIEGQQEGAEFPYYVGNQGFPNLDKAREWVIAHDDTLATRMEEIVNTKRMSSDTVREAYSLMAKLGYIDFRNVSGRTYFVKKERIHG